MPWSALENYVRRSMQLTGRRSAPSHNCTDTTLKRTLRRFRPGGTIAELDAFDSDVLIYAAGDDARATAIRAVIRDSSRPLGSTVLIPEVLTRPMRRGERKEYDVLVLLLAQLDLKAVDDEIADAATVLGANYGLRAADAIHLATAVVWGADRFHTNNRKDFGPHITEVEVVYPA